MIAIQNMAAQGDVLFRRVASLPAEARAQPRNGPLVVAHSETGHHHVIDSPDAQLFASENPFICYLRLETPFVDVVHQRSFHTHVTLRLLGHPDGKPSYFEVRRQREHSPDGDRQVED